MMQHIAVNATPLSACAISSLRFRFIYAPLNSRCAVMHIAVMAVTAIAGIIHQPMV